MRPASYNKKWPAIHLGELLHFLEEQNGGNVSIKALSEKLGLTCQYVSILFRKDNMKLSRAEKIAKAYGYELKLYFPQKEWKFGPFFMPAETEKREFPNARNLGGLVKYMNDSNKTVNSFCKELGISNNVLTKAFNNGDIFISVLYKIVKKMGIEFVWSFENGHAEGLSESQDSDIPVKNT